MIKKKLAVNLLLGCFCLSATAQKASLEDIDTDSLTSKIFELNPVVVTGTGTYQRLKHTPTPVSVITSNEIKRAGITDFQQAMTMMAPTISFSTNAMGSYLMMNGLSNKYVLILVNGRKLTGDTSNNIDINRIDMSRVKRIEVLNGAASSLYGSDAMAGVINIITDEPKDNVSFGSNSRYTGKNQFTQSLNMDIAKGKFGSYTSYKYDHSDGWQNNTQTLDGDGDLVESVTPLSIGYSCNNFAQKFVYDATSRLSLYANGGYYWRLTDRPIAREGLDGGSNYNLQYESFNWGAGAKYKLNKRSSLQLDYTGTDYFSRYKYLTTVGDYMLNDYALTKNQVFHDVELKGIFGFATNSTTVFGVDYRSESLNRPSANVDKDVSTSSAYGQHEVKLWGHFTGIVGARFDYHSQAGGRLSPKVAAMYNLGSFNVRVSYSAGYRAPGLDELYYHLAKPMGSKFSITMGDENLKPEHSNYYSLNLEYRTARFSASVTGYINYLTDMISSETLTINDMDDPTAFRQWLMTEFDLTEAQANKQSSVKQYVNFDKANIKGVEVNVSGNPLPGVTLSGNYTYAYARGKGADGWQNIERSIRHTATLTGNYMHSWNDYTLNVNLTGRIQSKRYHPGDSDGDAPGYGLWSLHTKHSFDCFRNFFIEPGIGIDNIFNKKDNRPLGVNYSLLSPGRMVVISLALRIK